MTITVRYSNTNIYKYWNLLICIYKDNPEKVILQDGKCGQINFDEDSLMQEVKFNNNDKFLTQTF